MTTQYQPFSQKLFPYELHHIQSITHNHNQQSTLNFKQHPANHHNHNHYKNNGSTISQTTDHDYSFRFKLSDEKERKRRQKKKQFINQNNLHLKSYIKDMCLLSSGSLDHSNSLKLAINHNKRNNVQDIQGTSAYIQLHDRQINKLNLKDNQKQINISSFPPIAQTQKYCKNYGSRTSERNICQKQTNSKQKDFQNTIERVYSRLSSKDKVKNVEINSKKEDFSHQKSKIARQLNLNDMNRRVKTQMQQSDGERMDMNMDEIVKNSKDAESSKDSKYSKNVKDARNNEEYGCFGSIFPHKLIGKLNPTYLSNQITPLSSKYYNIQLASRYS